MRLSRFIAWVLLCISSKGNVASSEFIRPSAILVTTVIDVSNKVIVRDALTLFRSIRLFGGTFNEATFLAYITVDDTFVDRQELLANLSSLRVNWDVVRPVQGVLPKTMNKFYAMEKFDALKYEYLLWLDADLVLFQDPMPHLMAHKYPGQIQCVPDLYNYLKRFPMMNGSEIVWNSEMSEYQLDGEGEYAPHGLCNTGFILFDKLSLSTFMGSMNETLNLIKPINPFRSDRFLDSLVFISIVNRLNIDVLIRGYELNYMSFFEIEMLSSSDVNDVVFAHFITDTELYCLVSEEDGACRCIYHNTRLVEKSPLVSRIEQLSNKGVCHVLAGQLSMSEYERMGYPTAISYASDVFSSTTNGYPTMVFAASSEEMQVMVLQWPQTGVKIFHDFSLCRIPIQIECSFCSNELMKGLSFSIELSFNVKDNSDAFVYSVEQSLDGAPQSAAIVAFDIVFDLEKDMHDPTGVNNRYNTMLSETQVHLKISAKHLALQSSGAECHFLLVRNSLTFPGLTRFSDNLLQGRKPIALSTQLNLPSYLGVWQKRGYGVVVCCDTASGIDVVENLILNWGGGALVIMMRHAPEEAQLCPTASGGHKVADWVNYFEQMCKDAETSLLCLIFDIEKNPRYDDAYQYGMQLINHQDLSFVYIDVFENYFDYVVHVMKWIDLLPKGSILFGSQYVSTIPCPGGGSDSLECVYGVRPAVDSAGHSARRAVLATYGEESSGAKRSGSNKYCRAFRRLERLSVSVETDSNFCEGIKGNICLWNSLNRLNDSYHVNPSWASQCHVGVRELDCAPAWYFHILSPPLPKW